MKKDRHYGAEIRALVQLAIPALMAQVAMTAMGFVDMVMTGRVGPVDMAAVALAGSLWMPLLLFCQGIILAVTPGVAQLRGASGAHRALGHLMRQGCWLALALSVPLMLTLYWISFHLEWMGVEPHLAEPTGAYLRFIMWAAPGNLLFVALRCGMEGMTLMRPAMMAGFFGLLCNIPLNYTFIFGKFGMPALGGPGTGLATAIVLWLMFFSMVISAARQPAMRRFLRPRSWDRPDWTTLWKLVKIGFPGAMAIFFEVTLFALVAILIAPLGAIQVAGHQVALNFSGLLYMVGLSIGISATIRTGYALGQHNVEAVETASRSIYLLAIIASSCTACITILLRGSVAAIYNDDPAVLELAAHLLLFAGIYQIADAIQVVSVGILRGYNDTKAIFLGTLISYWGLALPLGYVLGRTSLLGEPMGPQGFWIAFVVGLAVAAVFFCLRVRKLERRIAREGFGRIRMMS